MLEQEEEVAQHPDFLIYRGLYAHQHQELRPPYFASKPHRIFINRDNNHTNRLSICRCLTWTQRNQSLELPSTHTLANESFQNPEDQTDRAFPSPILCRPLQRRLKCICSRLRQQRKVRPGYTPQEDVSLFRGSRQAVAAPQNRNAPGYLPPGAAPKAAAGAGGDKPLSKAAAKNAKRRAKKQAEKEEEVKDNWDSDSDGDKAGKMKGSSEEKDQSKKEPPKEKGSKEEDAEAVQETKKDIETTTTTEKTKDVGSDLTTKVAKLDLGS